MLGKVLFHHLDSTQTDINKSKRNFGHSMSVEILEIISGEEIRRTIEIFNGDDGACLQRILKFKTDSVYVFSLFHSRETMETG